MSALSVLSTALYRNTSHHEHPCTAVVLTLAWHPFIRVDTASEAVYELVAESIQEPQVREQQEDAVEHASEGIANPADLQGKPRSITLILSIQCLFKYFVHLCSRSCMEL